MQKIMFNDKYGLTDAVLQGTKTMTRRVVPEREVEKYQEWYDDVLSIGFDDLSVEIQSFEDVVRNRARYSVGEIVAVAQSYKHIYCVEPHQRLTEEYSVWFLHQEGLTYTKGWKNKMFVKPDYMPHQIHITDIKVERLQDISDEDCLKEGITRCPDKLAHKVMCNGCYPLLVCDNCYQTPREAFAALIDKVSGKGTWEKNPLVFAYGFELIK